MRRHVLTISVLVTLLVALGAGVVGASPLARPSGQAGAPTVVSYQGQVTVDGAPYNGTGYFKFAVVDASGGTTYWSHDGTASGEPANAVSLTVTNGLFTVLLGDTGMSPLDASAFDGSERYLRVWFASSTAGPFQRLEPDRRIAAVPYALQAASADTLDGLHAADLRARYQNVVVVAKSGGDYDTITGALNSITGASDTNRYLVWVAPGVYEEQVTMKPFVDIEGAGELATRIRSAGGQLLDATVTVASDAELRSLTVENTGGGEHATAIYNPGASPRLTNVTAIASGGSKRNYCLYNAEKSSPTIKNVTFTAYSSGFSCYSYGLYNRRASATISQSSIRAIDENAGFSLGIYNWNLGAEPYTVRVDHSLIQGGSAGIFGDIDSTTYVGASQLIGPIDTSLGGGFKCVGCYDENYAPRSCP